MTQKEKNNRIKGIAGTILFHAIILLAILFYGLTVPSEPPPEQGIEVNLGYNEVGMGNIQLPTPSAQPSSPPVPQDRGKEEVVTQDIEEAPAVKTTGVKPKTTTTDKKPVEKPKEPVINPDALYKGKVQGTGNTGNEGITNQPGDQGNPNSSPDATNYEGLGGSGSNISYSLTNRSPKYLPKPSNRFTEDGTVVVQIFVDKYGKVTRAIAIDKGSNTTNSVLRRLAVDAARQSVFNVDTDAPIEQKGTITYHFIIRN
ncbi:MAG: hypothetical protein FJY10_06920 [Bacteroidetes bacterium]|nr:hypothetical protein [Bacteroidota bacterium]